MISSFSLSILHLLRGPNVRSSLWYVLLSFSSLFNKCFTTVKTTPLPWSSFSIQHRHLSLNHVAKSKASHIFLGKMNVCDNSAQQRLCLALRTFWPALKVFFWVKVLHAGLLKNMFFTHHMQMIPLICAIPGLMQHYAIWPIWPGCQTRQEACWCRCAHFPINQRRHSLSSNYAHRLHLSQLDTFLIHKEEE